MGVLQPSNALPSLKDSYATVKDDQAYKRKTLQQRVVAALPKRAKLGVQTSRPSFNSAAIDDLLETRTAHASTVAADLPRGPTDFSGLIPSRCGEDAAQPGPESCLRTFEHVTTQRHASAPALGLPSAGNWLPPALPLPGASGPTAGDATRSGVAQGLDPSKLPPSTCAPMDWSMKTNLRLVSPRPFLLAQEALRASARDVLEAQRCVLARSDPALLAPHQQYLAALTSFQYPLDPRGAARGGHPDTAARRGAWQAALCSLYDALRAGACDAFYVVPAEGGKRPALAFFGAAGVGGRRQPHGLLTRSTPGLRSMLSNGLGLAYDAPLLPQTGAAPQDQSAIPAAGTCSLLSFQDEEGVHGLFDFLLNEAFRAAGDEADVPLLLAPVPFLHGAMVAARPKLLSSVEVRGGSAASSQQFRMELRGLTPAWTVDRLVQLLGSRQPLSMACDTHPLTLALNWPGPADAARARESKASRDVGAALVRGACSAEEGERWACRGAGQPSMGCNVLRGMEADGRGTFTGLLSSKSAEHML
ncbi:hypothetical protein ACKKBG_A16565 [Auxenochlorella protothecoides x Auxenochlorella symbiontica]